jgi:predicted RNase H-like nuclease (RuvC/YqgF family)
MSVLTHAMGEKIGQLTTENEQLRAEIERLKADNERLRGVLARKMRQYDVDMMIMRDALNREIKARRTRGW